MLIKGILCLAAIFVVFVVGILALDAVIWGEREGIVKRGYAGEHDENNDDI